MADKKFIVKPGGRVIIEINRSPEVRNSKFTGHLSPKGLIGARREDEYLPRRRRKQAGFINFFDMGLVASGEDYALVYDGYEQAAATHTPGSDFIDHPITIEMRSAYFNDLSVAVFSIDDAVKRETFYPIIRGDLNYEKHFEVEFGLTNDTLENLPDTIWTPEGLKVPASDLQSLKLRPPSVLFNSTEIDFASVVIKDGDTDADVDNFILAANADIYFFPTPIMSSIDAIYRNGSIDTGFYFDYIQVEEFAPRDLRIMPREFLADYNAILEIVGGDSHSWAWHYSQIIKQYPGRPAKRLTLTPNGESSTDRIETFENMPTTDIPNSTYFNSNGRIIINTAHRGLSLATNFNFELSPQPLKCLIYQNNHWYYVWQPV